VSDLAGFALVDGELGEDRVGVEGFDDRADLTRDGRFR